MAKRTTIPEITGQHVEQLSEEVCRLHQEIRVLRDVLAELVEDVQWAIRNGIVPSEVHGERFRLTSMPTDPCTEDFHARVNEVSDADRRQLREQQAGVDQGTDDHDHSDLKELKARKQRALWSDDQTTSQRSS